MFLRWIFLLFLLFVAKTSLAADCYLDVAAKGTGDGSSAENALAFGTSGSGLTTCMGLVSAGDTVHIASGAYTVTSTISWTGGSGSLGSTVNFTINSTSDVITSNSHGLSTDDAIFISSSGNMPMMEWPGENEQGVNRQRRLTTDRMFFVRKIDNNTFKISLCMSSEDCHYHKANYTEIADGIMDFVDSGSGTLSFRKVTFINIVGDGTDQNSYPQFTGTRERPSEAGSSAGNMDTGNYFLKLTDNVSYLKIENFNLIAYRYVIHADKPQDSTSGKRNYGIIVRDIYVDTVREIIRVAGDDDDACGSPLWTCPSASYGWYLANLHAVNLTKKVLRADYGFHDVTVANTSGNCNDLYGDFPIVYHFGENAPAYYFTIFDSGAKDCGEYLSTIYDNGDAFALEGLAGDITLIRTWGEDIADACWDFKGGPQYLNDSWCMRPGNRGLRAWGGIFWVNNTVVGFSALGEKTKFADGTNDGMWSEGVIKAHKFTSLNTFGFRTDGSSSSALFSVSYDSGNGIVPENTAIITNATSGQQAKIASVSGNGTSGTLKVFARKRRLGYNSGTGSAPTVRVSTAIDTVDITANTFADAGTDVADGDPVYITADSMPGGLTSGNIYWVRNKTTVACPATITYQLSDTPAGSIIDITSIGDEVLVWKNPIVGQTSGRGATPSSVIDASSGVSGFLGFGGPPESPGFTIGEIVTQKGGFSATATTTAMNFEGTITADNGFSATATTSGLTAACGEFTINDSVIARTLEYASRNTDLAGDCGSGNILTLNNTETWIEGVSGVNPGYPNGTNLNFKGLDDSFNSSVYTTTKGYFNYDTVQAPVAVGTHIK